MSFRIFRRQRERLCYPWNYYTGDKTLAELDTLYADAGRDYYQFLGPFTLPQVMRLLYSNSQFGVSAAIEATYTTPDPDETISGSISVVITSKLFPGTEVECDELTNFEQVYSLINKPVFDDRDELATPTFNAALSPVGNGYLPNYNGFTQFDPLLDIVKDENGKYWLDGLFFVDLYDGGDLIGWIDTRKPPTLETWEKAVTVRLSLGPGRQNDIDLYCTATLDPSYVDYVIDTATCSISDYRWYPYQTTAGTDAINTTTGGIANGGPGA